MLRRRPLRALLSTALAVTAGALAAMPATASAEYVTDGSFETTLSGQSAWSGTSSNFGTPFCDNPTCGNSAGSMVPRTGSVLVWFGGTSNVETGSAGQQVTVPAGRPTRLSFWLKAGRPKAGTSLRVSVGGVERWSFVEDFPDGSDPSGHPYAAYTRIEIPISASAFDGTPTPLRFDFVSPGGGGVVNYAIDDVSLVDEIVADASATISPASGTVRLGDEITYSLGLANAGPNPAAITLRGTLPPELELVSAGGLDLPCVPPASPGDELVCNGGTLASGAALTGQITVRATAVGTAGLTLTSEVAPPGEDPDPTNDSATATLEIEPVADLAATIDAPGDATVGVPFDVVLGARNDGPSPATDATLKSELPAGFTVDEQPADCAVNGSTVTCDVGALADGDDAERTLTVVPGVAGDVEFDARVVATEHDPDTANDRATADVRVATPPLPPDPEQPGPPVTTPEPPVLPAPPTPVPVPPVATPEPPVAPVCLSERRFTTRLLRGRSGPGLRIPVASSRARIVSARLSGGPRSWKARNAKRARSTVDVDLRGAPVGRYTLRVRVRIAAAGRSKARTVTVTRTYRTCQPGR